MAESRIRISKQLQKSTNPGAVLITDSSNEMSFLEAISGSDKLIFYDDSAGAVTWLTVGTNLSITGTTLNASAGAGGYTEVQEEGSALAAQSKLNFIGGGITAADDGANSRTNVTLDATLNALAAYNTDGILVIEHGQKTDLSAKSIYIETRKYGNVHFSFFNQSTD